VASALGRGWCRSPDFHLRGLGSNPQPVHRRQRRFRFEQEIPDAPSPSTNEIPKEATTATKGGFNSGGA
jgi:hypothetical protein